MLQVHDQLAPLQEKLVSGPDLPLPYGMGRLNIDTNGCDMQT